MMWVLLIYAQFFFSSLYLKWCFSDAGSLLKGEEKRKFDEIAQQLQQEKIKFLVILNALRRDAKPLSNDTEAFYTYRYGSVYFRIDKHISCANSSFDWIILTIHKKTWSSAWFFGRFRSYFGYSCWLSPDFTSRNENLCRECIHELSRFLHLLNKSPEGVVPDDGLYLANWATQILAIYDNQRRVSFTSSFLIWGLFL